jgi:hypothetical protein
MARLQEEAVLYGFSRTAGGDEALGHGKHRIS